jgi:hypothetical protein
VVSELYDRLGVTGALDAAVGSKIKKAGSPRPHRSPAPDTIHADYPQPKTTSNVVNGADWRRIKAWQERLDGQVP